MGLQNKGICNERLFCYTEVQSAEYHYPFYLNIIIVSAFSISSLSSRRTLSIFEFLTKFPFEKCILLPGYYDAYFKSYNTFSIC